MLIVSLLFFTENLDNTSKHPYIKNVKQSRLCHEENYSRLVNNSQFSKLILYLNRVITIVLSNNTIIYLRFLMTQLLKLPALWLITLIVGLPLLSETVYTPSLPEIGQDLGASDSAVEYTLTVYLFGFAVGTLFWGKISDIFGRKPCLLSGLGIYVIGCISCYYSPSIEWLMVSRFIQAFGGSTGSVLGQAISRDAFHGAALGKMYASVSSSMAVFPAIGPVIGGLIAQNFDWRMIFTFLILCGTIIGGCVAINLPETHSKEKRQPISILKTLKLMASDRQVIGFGFLVAGCNGIAFSYYAEGSFYLIEMLHLTPSMYGCTFIAISAAAMIGGMISRRLHNTYSSLAILRVGLLIMLTGTGLFTAGILLNQVILLPEIFIIGFTIACMMLILGGSLMVTSNSLSAALINYRYCIGTASSLFGFSYYCVVSLITGGMGLLHNDTLFPMPLYFFFITGMMLVIFAKMIQPQKLVEAKA